MITLLAFARSEQMVMFVRILANRLPLSSPISQETVSELLNLPAHKVHCKVKRLGGGFGGKETRSVNVAAYASLVAHLLKVCMAHTTPERCWLALAMQVSVTL